MAKYKRGDILIGQLGGGEYEILSIDENQYKFRHIKGGITYLTPIARIENENCYKLKKDSPKYEVGDILKTERNQWKIIEVAEMTYKLVSLGRVFIRELVIDHNSLDHDSSYYKHIPGREYGTFTPTGEPECTCCSKVLFDEGCRCEYAAWKRGDKS